MEVSPPTLDEMQNRINKFLDPAVRIFCMFQLKFLDILFYLFYLFYLFVFFFFDFLILFDSVEVYLFLIILAMRRVNKKFNAKMAVNARSYEYL